ncbi:MAG: hypothetical protein JSV49_06695 [Thermoplasmata archaeon]|nr:MAG: hypothetical protein JSV49_06695 [Thermoplasmata archaeon]
MSSNKSRPTLKPFCHFHNEIPASFLCDSCGKSLCMYCQRNRDMPYQCPECMPAFWEKKVKKERMIFWTPVLAIIAVILLLTGWLIVYEPEDEEYSSIYVTDEDIIPILHEETYNLEGNNEIDLTIKVYVTNWGTKDSEEVFLELYVMKSGTVRYEAQSAKAVVGEDKTEVFTIETTVQLDTYDFKLMVWEGDMVIQQGSKAVKVTESDLEDQSEFGFGYRAEYEEDESKEAGEPLMGRDYSTMMIVILLIVIIPIILIVTIILYKMRTKMPEPPMMPPPGLR